jgi:predicted DNA-binding ribbon-helix-helix protein
MNENKKNIKMNLTLKREFFEVLKQQAERDHLKVSTWVKQFLVKRMEEHLNQNQDDFPF